jgi:hypothetical protein
MLETFVGWRKLAYARTDLGDWLGARDAPRPIPVHAPSDRPAIMHIAEDFHVFGRHETSLVFFEPAVVLERAPMLLDLSITKTLGAGGRLKALNPFFFPYWIKVPSIVPALLQNRMAIWSNGTPPKPFDVAELTKLIRET